MSTYIFMPVKYEKFRFVKINQKINNAESKLLTLVNEGETCC